MMIYCEVHDEMRDGDYQLECRKCEDEFVKWLEDDEFIAYASEVD